MSLFAGKKHEPVIREKTDPILAEIKALKEPKRERTTIYRPGHVPKWADGITDDDGSLLQRRNDIRNKLTARKGDLKGDRKRVQPEILAGPERKKATAEIVGGDDIAVKMEDEEPRVKIDTSSLAVPEALDTAEDDELEDRRARARARKLGRAEEEDNEAEMITEEEEQKPAVEEEEESEYEEDDDYSSKPLFKPVFVSKKQRETLEEKKKLEEEEVAVQEEMAKRAAERRTQSRQLVVKAIERDADEEKAKQAAEGEELPDDEDDVDDIAELESWKLRELNRLKRDLEEREKWEKEAAETARRRNMTDDEIKREDAAKRAGMAPKGTYKFLQKYYHQGAYYQAEDEDVFKRDFTAPTGADKEIDRELLPKVLQVKKFGLKGRTKYTHLVDQDTSAFDRNPWVAAEPGRQIHLKAVPVHAAQFSEQPPLPDPAVKTLGERKLAGTGTIQMPTRKKKT